MNKSISSPTQIIHYDTMSICQMIFRITDILPMMVRLRVNSLTASLPNHCLLNLTQPTPKSPSLSCGACSTLPNPAGKGGGTCFGGDWLDG